MTQTPEQETKLAAQKIALVAQVLATQTDKSIIREDVEYLVSRYFDLRLSQRMGHGEALRLTYGCLYQQPDIRFNPRARIAELRVGK